jgi:hypothetical protein
MVFPVVVGSGKSLFGDRIETTVLRLVDTKMFGSGGRGRVTSGAAKARQAEQRSYGTLLMPDSETHG